MKKIMLIILSLSLMCLALTGCVANINDIIINDDESGVFTVTAGISEEAVAIMQSMPESDEETELNTEGAVEFEHNGIKYFGETTSSEFSSIEELSELLNTSLNSEEDLFSISKSNDGEIIITLKNAKEAANTDEMLSETESLEMDLTKEEQEALLAQFAILLNFTFPNPVTQTSGTSAGVIIEDNKLSLDIMAMATEAQDDTVYEFKTVKSNQEVTSTPEQVETAITFLDVSSEAWYYDAITALAKIGLVNGVGDNKFNPEDTLTIAQFCQILARAKNLPTGNDANGYWAGIAISGCLSEGYVLSSETISPENYDKPITREAAVSAMYLASKSTIENSIFGEISLEDIPDNADISEEYKENVVNAYNFGITKGNDDKLTFNPQGSLTRAQVCQLFYNLGFGK